MIVVRPLQSEDCSELSEIEEESFSMPWSEQDFRDLLIKDYTCYMVAEYEGKPVGTAGMTISFDEGNIDNVVVKEDFRHKNIGTLLMEKLIEEGIKRGVRAFTLEVRVSNTNAISLYKKMGFESAGVRPNFYDKPKEDAEIMWLYTDKEKMSR